VTLNPSHLDAQAKLGNIYMKKGDKEKAVTHWEKALELDPTNDILRNNLKIVRGN
jgi:Flp pilus assembly protein TadD